MTEPNLHESAWQKAKESAADVYRSVAFGVALTLVTLIAVSVSVIAQSHKPVAAQIAVPILSGTVAVLLAFILVLVIQLAAAPLRQRNELRAAWKPEPIKTVNIGLTLRDAYRKGNDLVHAYSHKTAFTREEVRAADGWADEVVNLMAGNAPDAATQEFLEAGSEERGSIRRLRIRVGVLKTIIDNLP